MAMRLAFDMDGVLADLHTVYAQAALKLYPELDRAAIATAEKNIVVSCASLFT